MSADNGIYIAKFPEGYRCAYGHNIENIDYFPAGSKERKLELKSYFDGSKILATREEAYIEAERIKAAFFKEDDFCILEYGICYIGEYETWENKKITS